MFELHRQQLALWALSSLLRAPQGPDVMHVCLQQYGSSHLAIPNTWGRSKDTDHFGLAAALQFPLSPHASEGVI